MTIRFLSAWLDRLIPDRHRAAAATAERDAFESRQSMRDVARSRRQVEDLMRRMNADLIENHFAERVANALGRPHS